MVEYIVRKGTIRENVVYGGFQRRRIPSVLPGRETMLDSTLFFLQIAVITGVSCLVAFLVRKIGQPQVIGEMVAGIAIGPTLFGFLAPHAYQSLFPPASLGFLTALSQSGLVIFIFLIGMRVDFAEMRRQSAIVVVTSNVSVLVPLLMGMGLAQYLFPRYGNGDRLAFSMFIGTAMSVTAFPVLARILMERKLLGTRLGSIAIACAAVGDVTAWILLAIAVVLVQPGHNAHSLWLMLLRLTIYAIVLLAVRWLLDGWSKSLRGELPSEAILIFVVLALVSGAVGEWIGIHALVGAFMAGLVTPRMFRQPLIDKLEGLTLLVLIPLFFALTGLRTNLVFRVGAGSYLDLLLILLVAIVSKWGGTMVGARSNGMGWLDACRLGLLMNTRGLVELIVLGVGLDRGILSPRLFSMMVCMALVTTVMAVPLMDWFGHGQPDSSAAMQDLSTDRVAIGQ